MEIVANISSVHFSKNRSVTGQCKLWSGATQTSFLGATVFSCWFCVNCQLCVRFCDLSRSFPRISSKWSPVIYHVRSQFGFSTVYVLVVNASVAQSRVVFCTGSSCFSATASWLSRPAILMWEAWRAFLPRWPWIDSAVALTLCLGRHKSSIVVHSLQQTLLHQQSAFTACDGRSRAEPEKRVVWCDRNVKLLKCFGCAGGFGSRGWTASESVTQQLLAGHSCVPPPNCCSCSFTSFNVCNVALQHNGSVRLQRLCL